MYTHPRISDHPEMHHQELEFRKKKQEPSPYESTTSFFPHLLGPPRRNGGIFEPVYELGFPDIALPTSTSNAPVMLGSVGLEA